MHCFLFRSSSLKVDCEFLLCELVSQDWCFFGHSPLFWSISLLCFVWTPIIQKHRCWAWYTQSWDVLLKTTWKLTVDSCYVILSARAHIDVFLATCQSELQTLIPVILFIHWYSWTQPLLCFSVYISFWGFTVSCWKRKQYIQDF